MPVLTIIHLCDVVLAQLLGSLWWANGILLHAFHIYAFAFYLLTCLLDISNAIIITNFCIGTLFIMKSTLIRKWRSIWVELKMFLKFILITLIVDTKWIVFISIDSLVQYKYKIQFYFANMLHCLWDRLIWGPWHKQVQNPCIYYNMLVYYLEIEFMILWTHVFTR